MTKRAKTPKPSRRPTEPRNPLVSRWGKALDLIRRHNEAPRDIAEGIFAAIYVQSEQAQRPALGFTVSEPSMGGKWLMASQASAERRLLYLAS